MTEIEDRIRKMILEAFGPTKADDIDYIKDWFPYDYIQLPEALQCEAFGTGAYLLTLKERPEAFDASLFIDSLHICEAGINPELLRPEAVAWRSHLSVDQRWAIAVTLMYVGARDHDPDASLAALSWSYFAIWDNVEAPPSDSS